MTQITVLGNRLVIFHQPPSSKKNDLGLKRYHYTLTVAQAKQRLKLAQEAHALRDNPNAQGTALYKGRRIPKVSALVASKITGNTSGFASRKDWYKAHRTPSELVEASIQHLRNVAGATVPQSYLNTSFYE